MASKKPGLLEFISFLNNDITNSNDCFISKVILSHIGQVSNISLESIAQEAHISTASISRFIKKAGFSSFQEFKNCLSNSNINLLMRRRLTHTQKFYQMNDMELADSLFQEVDNNLKQTKLNLDIDKLHRIIDVMKSSNAVSFLGDNHELQIFYTLQLDLIANDIPAFLIDDDKMGLSHSHHLKGNDCLIYINLNEDWFNSRFKKILSIAKEKGTKIIVLSQDDLNIDADIVYRYGVPRTDNDGYYSLMYLNRVLCEMIYQ